MTTIHHVIREDYDPSSPFVSASVGTLVLPFVEYDMNVT